MTLRRLIAQTIDRDLNDELADLRDRNVEQHLTIQAQRALLRDMAAQRAVEQAIASARIENAEDDARDARADVARLLEDAARCAHEHQT